MGTSKCESINKCPLRAHPNEYSQIYTKTHLVCTFGDKEARKQS